MNTLVVGDVHNNFVGMMDAYNYARLNQLRIIFVGDIVDYGKDAQNTILFAQYLAKTKKAQFVKGNHDDKIYRYAKGNDVKYHPAAMESTVNALTNTLVESAFFDLYDSMNDYINFGNTYITHGAFIKDFWEDSSLVSDTINRGFLYGEIDSNKHMIEYNGQMYPHRVYDWVDYIPSGVTVVVGHDRSPFEALPTFDKNLSDVLIKENNAGGTAIFTDTGSGKGGFLSGVVLDSNGIYQKTVQFK